MLKAGDYIQCADAEEMAQYMTDLERMGIQADFDFSHGERIKIFGPGWIRRFTGTRGSVRIFSS